MSGDEWLSPIVRMRTGLPVYCGRMAFGRKGPLVPDDQSVPGSTPEDHPVFSHSTQTTYDQPPKRSVHPKLGRNQHY
jgi:hypothetical protein